MAFLQACTLSVDAVWILMSRNVKLVFLRKKILAEQVIIHLDFREANLYDLQESTTMTKTKAKSFSCSICGKQFKINSGLVNHLPVHLEERPFKCDYCNKSFKVKVQLRTHEKIHSGMKPFKCDICGKRSLRRSHHNQHLLTHTVKDKPWLCNINNCSAKYKTSEDLSIHKRTVHDLENSARHECIFCQNKFIIKRDLERHLLKHIQERPYLCKFCPLDFQHIGGLWRHLKLHDQPHLQKKYSCQDCSREFRRKDALAKHNIRFHAKTEKPHKCITCQKAFRFSYELNSHEKIHTKPYSCLECGKSFASQKILQNHIDQHTVPGRHFECDICFSRFRLENYLMNHKKLAHDPSFSKRFQCLFCHQGFARQFSLSEHILGHTQERPYFCKICSLEFRLKTGLRLHLRGHQSDRRKEFQCELCPKQYFTNWDLLSHLHIHTGELPMCCDLCPKRFANLDKLRRHHREIHTERIPFHCELCGKQILTKDSLQRHMRLHTGERPIGCRYCEQTFADPTSRHYHERRHHPHPIT